jgi:hypothetical protein
VGSRTHRRDTFLCAESHIDVVNAENAVSQSAKEKYPKEIRPMPLVSCVPQF